MQVVEEVVFRRPLEHCAQGNDAASRHEDLQYSFECLVSPHDADDDVEQKQQ